MAAPKEVAAKGAGANCQSLAAMIKFKGRGEERRVLKSLEGLWGDAHLSCGFA